MLQRKLFLGVIIYFFCTSLFALKVGVTAGPHAVIMEKVKSVAAESGLNIQIVTFNDFILPNAALNQGDLDANSYQHLPFLEEQIRTRGYKLKTIAKTVTMPLGIYTLKLSKLSELKDKARIAIPNDPTNGSRALILLEQQGCIRLSQKSLPSILDIKENPKQLKFIEIEAPQLPRTLQDVDIAVINTDWVLLAGMDPKTALILEPQDTVYANWIVVRQDTKMTGDLEKLVNAYHSEAVKSFIYEMFKGAVLPTW
jgi:D-methionine transport system substrate-binding protein